MRFQVPYPSSPSLWIVNGVRKYTTSTPATVTTQLLPMFLNTRCGLPQDGIVCRATTGGSTCYATERCGRIGTLRVDALRRRNRCGLDPIRAAPQPPR